MRRGLAALRQVLLGDARRGPAARCTILDDLGSGWCARDRRVELLRLSQR